MSTAPATTLMTADEYWEWGQRPENSRKRTELVRGEIIEMSSPGEIHVARGRPGGRDGRSELGCAGP